MKLSRKKVRELLDNECKRYFNFDGVMVGVLYLLHKYMPDYYQKRSFEEIYDEWMYHYNQPDYVRVLNNDMHSASNHLLKVDKLVDVKMKNCQGENQRTLVEIEMQNRFQSYFWQRACNYLCRVRSEYLAYLNQYYENQWIPIISCWFMACCPCDHYPFVLYSPFKYVDDNHQYLMLAIISFQYSKYPPETDDQIELAFYKLLSPYASEEERYEACKVLKCEITREEITDMCNYSDVCMMYGKEDGIIEGRKEGIVIGMEQERKMTIKLMLEKMSVEEVADIYSGKISKSEIIAIQNEMAN